MKEITSNNNTNIIPPVSSYVICDPICKEEVIALQSQDYNCNCILIYNLPLYLRFSVIKTILDTTYKSSLNLSSDDGGKLNRSLNSIKVDSKTDKRYRVNKINLDYLMIFLNNKIDVNKFIMKLIELMHIAYPNILVASNFDKMIDSLKDDLMFLSPKQEKIIIKGKIIIWIQYDLKDYAKINESIDIIHSLNESKIYSKLRNPMTYFYLNYLVETFVVIENIEIITEFEEYIKLISYIPQLYNRINYNCSLRIYPTHIESYLNNKYDIDTVSQSDKTIEITNKKSFSFESLQESLMNNKFTRISLPELDDEYLNWLKPEFSSYLNYENMELQDTSINLKRKRIEFIASNQKPYFTIILDIDNTLLQAINDNEIAKHNIKEEADGVVEISLPNSYTIIKYHIYLRNGIIEFLFSLNKNSNLIIYTNAIQSYADKIIKIINDRFEEKYKMPLNILYIKGSKFFNLKPLHSKKNILNVMSYVRDINHLMILDDSMHVWDSEDWPYIYNSRKMFAIQSELIKKEKYNYFNFNSYYIDIEFEYKFESNNFPEVSKGDKNIPNQLESINKILDNYKYVSKEYTSLKYYILDKMVEFFPIANIECVLCPKTKDINEYIISYFRLSKTYSNIILFIHGLSQEVDVRKHMQICKLNYLNSAANNSIDTRNINNISFAFAHEKILKLVYLGLLDDNLSNEMVCEL